MRILSAEETKDYDKKLLQGLERAKNLVADIDLYDRLAANLQAGDRTLVWNDEEMEEIELNEEHENSIFFYSK